MELLIHLIQLHAMVGHSKPKTLRIIGKIGNKDLTILIDGEVPTILSKIYWSF